MKPSIPKGTRDFSPAEMAKRNYIFGTIRDVFGLFGYNPIETPAMENLSTLMGKYGEEGDKLLFKILNSGDFLRGADPGLIKDGNCARLAPQLCEKGLRYDLTVPFARFVVQHRNELQMPFKRYQIQPVWRADRPQKGRYREFYQCDADVVGSDSLLNEIELLQLIDEVFRRLQIRIILKLNNRKVLAGIAELIGAPEKIIDITVAIDKIDKIGIDNVNAELLERGLTQQAVDALQPILRISGTLGQRLTQLETLLASSETGTLGVQELRTVTAGVEALGLDAELDLDVSLARGLNYYTGTIIEVKAKDVEIGSITGGGLRQPHRGVRDARPVGSGDIVRRRPNLRCAQCPRPIPCRGTHLDPGDVREFRRCRGCRIDEDDETAQSRRISSRNISRPCQDEKADGLCQCNRSPVCGNGRRKRDGRRQNGS